MSRNVKELKLLEIAPRNRAASSGPGAFGRCDHGSTTDPSSRYQVVTQPADQGDDVIRPTIYEASHYLHPRLVSSRSESWMVNFSDPAVVARDGRSQVKLWHTVYGLFLWEFFTTLDYEWRVFRGRSPYRWTIWIYSVTRVAGLMGAILSLVGLDVTTPINCQLWISSELFFSYTSLATASLLIVLRIIAIWNMNEIVMSIAIGTWVINVALLIQGVARLRATWVPTELTCVVYNSTENALTLISMAVADIVLLLMMLVGLLRLRYHGCATSGLTHLLWKQGLIWTAVATVAEVPPAVMIVLNLNGPLDIIFQVPAVVTMTIAATRMHRSLVCFTSGSSETPKNVQKSGLEFARANHAHSTTTPPNPMETAVCSILEQHLTPQVDNDSSINTDGQTHVKRNGLSLDSDVDVERGE